MFIVSLIEFSKHVQNEISAKVMPKPQNFTADFADEMKLSKAAVSRLAKQMIKVGKIIKNSVSLCRAKLSADVDGAERAARTNVRIHGNTAEHG
jgi:hypothetical protein